MITKKELLFFALAVSAVAGFLFSGLIEPTNHKTFKNIQENSLKTISFKRTYDEHNSKQIIRKTKTIKSISDFRKKLKKQSSNQKLAASSIRQKQKSKTETQQKNAKATASKKKKEDAKKKKAKKKKLVKKEINRIKPNFPDATDSLEGEVTSKDLSSKTPVSVVQTSNSNVDRLEISEDSEDDDNTLLGINSGATVANADITALNNDELKTDKSVYTNLLEQGNFSELEQILQTNLSETERVRSYTDSINFLFTQTDENYQAVDSFITSQFRNHRHAVVISKSLSNESFNTEKITYSVDLLTNLVASWSPQQDSNQFRVIYQEIVTSNIPTTGENQEIFTALQTSIEIKSASLTDSSVVISAN